MSLVGSISINTALTQTKGGVDLSTPSERVNLTSAKNITYGKMWHDRVKLLGGAVSAYVLNDGSLLDVYGRAVSLSAVNGLYIKGISTNSSGAFLSGGAGSPIADTPEVLANQAILYESDLNVTVDGNLYLVNPALSLSAEVDLVIVGS